MDTTNSLDAIFKPRSIAIIGASTQVEKWGHRMVVRPLNTGYRGAIYPVNPNAKEVAGLKSFATIADLPPDIDLAVITLPSPSVPKALRECLQHGIRGAVIISAGFAEAGKEGEKLQKEVVRIASEANIPLVGPNCMGLWSSPVNLNLAFEEPPIRGSITFISQSGTLGNYLMLLAKAKGYGFHSFVSSGNQATLEVADYLEYFGHDEETRAIILYIEGLQDAARFFRVAKEVVQKKPIMVYKAGRFEVGVRAALSHTASLAGNDRSFRRPLQTGRADPLLRPPAHLRHGHGFGHPASAKRQPHGHHLWRGRLLRNHVRICRGLGFGRPPTGPIRFGKDQENLQPFAPPPWNPVDAAADVRPMTYARALDILMSLDYIDGILMMIPFMFSFQLRSPASIRDLMDAIEIICGLPKKFKKPIIGNMIPMVSVGPALDLFKRAGIPFYATQDESARAMHGLVRYAQILSNGAK